MALSHEEWRRALNAVADRYDQYRPRYPAELPDDVSRLARLPAQGQILEVGCGTGQLTTAFAGRGHSILALEPGEALAAHARRNCASFPEVQIEVTTLEDWDSAGRRFDLLLAAQSFHLVDRARRFDLAAEVLVPGGSLAVVWNFRRPGESPAHRVLHEAYARYAPELPPDQRGSDTQFEDEIDWSGRFGRVFMCRYLWTQDYSSAEYLGLLASHASHHTLASTARAALFKAIETGLAQVGGSISIEYVTRLYLATRRD